MTLTPRFDYLRNELIRWMVENKEVPRIINFNPEFHRQLMIELGLKDHPVSDQFMGIPVWVNRRVADRAFRIVSQGEYDY